MKWVTREDVRIGRICCSWLISEKVDPGAEIAYLPGSEIEHHVEAGAIPFHVQGVEFDHRDGKTPFEAILEHHGLRDDPALDLMGRIVNGADTDNTLYEQPEGPGLRAISEGYRALHPGDDPAILAGMRPVVDALFAYCESHVSPSR
ncbi:MAG TPA: chromate resistance protein ChrB domain-containing protein [Gaiellaceae bacterium]|jgi:hypothetical protein